MSLRTIRSVFAFAIMLQLLIMTHELSHAGMALAFGQEVEQISIGVPFTPMIDTQVGLTRLTISPYLIGGFVTVDLEKIPDYQSFWIVVAGPAINLLIGAIGLLLLARINFEVKIDAELKHAVQGIPQIWDMIHNSNINKNGWAWLSLFFRLNIGLGFINLIPAHPLDGGKVVTYSLLTILPSGIADMITIGMTFLGFAFLAIIFIAMLTPKRYL